MARGKSYGLTYNKLLDELDVRARLLRQVVVRPGVRRRLVPALELLVLNDGTNVSRRAGYAGLYGYGNMRRLLLTTTSHISSRPRSAGK